MCLPTLVAGDIGISPAAVGAVTGFSLIPDLSATFSTSLQVVGKVYAASDLSPTPAKLGAAILDVQAAFNDASGRVSPDVLNLGAGKLMILS